MFYTFGSNDFMTEYIFPSMDAYQALGFPVESLELPGYGHCDADCDWDARTIGLWEGQALP
jgi:hypothetical protein